MSVWWRCLFHKFRRTATQTVDVFVPQDDVLEALQFPVLANSHEIQRKRPDVKSDQKEFLTDK